MSERDDASGCGRTMGQPRTLVEALNSVLEVHGVAATRILVAVSGGADSVALLRALHELARPLTLELIIAHYDHGLRAAAKADARFVEELGADLGLPVIIGRADPIDIPQTGIEAWARDARYRFLQSTALEQGCSIVMTAHTADDQVETVLHHLFRGTGLAGLAGIPASRLLCDRVGLVRPLLEVSRAQVEDYLCGLNQTYCTDETNTDTQFRRNWLRHELLPRIRAVYPDASSAIQRLSQHAAAATETLENLAAEWLNRAVVEETDAEVVLDPRALVNCPEYLLRVMLVQLWTRRGWPRQGMTAESWEQAAAVVRGTLRAIHCPGGGEVRRVGARVRLRGRGLGADSTGSSA
jgi:tRNA(Ile)-lysidine synthase